MADNTQLNTGTGGDIISSDAITTLNGAGIATGEKAQRMKVGFGSDSVLRDVDASNPLPVVQTGTPGLPTGASTEATLSSLNGKVTAVNTGAVVISSSALPTGASTETTLAALNTKVTAVNTGAVTVSSSVLPTGAATSAKQPALGTAGTPSADVLTVQGATSMTALKVDGSAVTQPVSGTVTASQATATNLKTQAETYQGGVAVSSAAPLQVTLANTAANATAVKVDGSAVTQPVSGTLSVNTHAVTQSGTWTVQPGNTANTTAWLVDEPGRSVAPHASLTAVATVSSAVGRYAGGSLINLNATPAYIQVFDTTGAVTLGTTAPTFYQPIPANATAANGSGYVFNIHPGITMTNGIKVAATTTATGATTVTTGLTGYTIYR